MKYTIMEKKIEIYNNAKKTKREIDNNGKKRNRQ